MRTTFQGGQIVAIKSSLPAIKGLSADAETAAGACGIPSVEVVEQYPLQASLCRSAYLLPEARQLASLGKITPLDFLHPDTLPSVTNHSERAHCGILNPFAVQEQRVPTRLPRGTNCRT